MATVYEQQSQEQPDAGQINEPAYKRASELLDQSIDMLSAWIADTEDMGEALAQEEEPASDFSMQMG